MTNLNDPHRQIDKKKMMREEFHLMRPPRMEGKVNHFQTHPAKKPKKKG